jgi:hypothetical protein
MHSLSFIAVCSLSLLLAACAVDSDRRTPGPAHRANAARTEAHGDTVPPSPPVAPLQRQLAPARIPYQLILPPLPASMPPPTGPQTPVPLTTCDSGGCWNAGVGPYQGGTGGNLLDRGGRQCIRNGAWIQCF